MTYCDETITGKYKVGRKTSSKKFRQKMKAVNKWLKSIRNQVELKEWWQVLRRKMTGHYNYYGISGNMQGISKFHYNCTMLAYKWMNRRSQKKSYNFEQFKCFIKYNPLPKPKIYQSMYALSS